MPDTKTARRTPFYGRRGEIARLGAQFDEGARLVTLLGSPGSGKSRLAEEYAAGIAPMLWFSVGGVGTVPDLGRVICDLLGVGIAAPRSIADDWKRRRS